MTGTRPVLPASLVALIAVGALSLAFHTPPEPQQQRVIRSSLPPYDPYDSIRTDLADYAWPTESTRRITSSFGEFRRTHFHGGIDISTNDRTGERVVASRAGYISRIRVSATGYGKMLYVRHPDTYTTTYSHLERFAERLEQRVRKEQQTRERYPVDIQCGPDEFPVRKGELIAFSGETGTGTPHLHFEILDENFNAINPLLCPDLRPLDDIAPEVRRIAVVPIGKNSTVNGAWEPLILSVRSTGPSRFTVNERVEITGKAGLAIQVRDRSNGTWFRHGVYANTLDFGSTRLFNARLDRVPMREGKQIGLYYNWELLRHSKGRFEKLYVDSPNDLPFLSPNVVGTGIIDASVHPEGTHQFRVVSRDLKGNRSEVTGTLLLNKPLEVSLKTNGSEMLLITPEPRRIRQVILSTTRDFASRWSTQTLVPTFVNGSTFWPLPIDPRTRSAVGVVGVNAYGTRSAPAYHFTAKPNAPGGSLSFQHECRDGFIRLSLSTSGIFTAQPTVLVREGGVVRQMDIQAVDLRQYVTTFEPLDTVGSQRSIEVSAEINGESHQASHSCEAYPIVPGRSGVYSIDDGQLLIRYGPRSTFKTLLLELKRISTDEGSGYRLQPDHALLRDGLLVSLRKKPAGRQPQRIYFRGRGDWKLVSGQRDTSEAYVTARIDRTPGDIAILTDVSPPFVTDVRLPFGSRKKPLISFRFGDDLAGVDYESLKTYIDEVFVVPEIDGENHRAVCRFPDPLPRGSHLLTIRISDVLGNSATVERLFEVR